MIPSLAHDDSLPALTDGSASGAGGQSLIPGANATAQMIDVGLRFKARSTPSPCIGSANWPSETRTRPPPLFVNG